MVSILDPMTKYTMENAYNSVSCFADFIKTRSKMVNDMIIVHLTVLKPEVDIIDVKYTTADQFAKFGGNFGIFAQITGCSFLVLLNIFILMFKLPFSSNDQ